MTRSADRLDAFTYGYAFTMLWANTRDGDREVYAEDWQTPGEGWELDAFTPAARAQIAEDCGDFMLANMRDLIANARITLERGGYYSTDERAWRQAGADFALTRNGHGAGFWDNAMGAVGDRLTSAAHVYGSSNGEVTADGPVELV